MDDNWISVKDKLPNFAYQGHTAILIAYRVLNFKSVRSGLWNQKTKEFQHHDFGIFKNITHWQPLPPPPKGDNHE